MTLERGIRRYSQAALKRACPVALKKPYWHVRDRYSRLESMYGLIGPLRDYLSDRVDLPSAEAAIGRLLDCREQNFLTLVREQIYERPDSPYRKLLKHAGCGFGDLATNVRRDGLERTLAVLAAEGVYLTSEEFKGKKEVRRGNLAFGVFPSELEPATPRSGYTIHSSGTRNAPVSSFISLDYLRLRTYATCVFFAANDLFGRAHAMYDGILPASGGLNNLLLYSRFGVATERWFARAVPGPQDPYSRLTTHLIVIMGKLFGPGFPKPEFIGLGEVERIVRWIAENNRQGKSCCVTAAASNATRIARLAVQMGVSLEGTKFICSGEPFTDAKREVIERAGATGISRYAYGSGVNIGFGCGHPAYTDEIHVNQSMVALISHRRVDDGGAPIDPLLCTTLDPYAPRVLLNVESGDYATMHKRNCGCALERVGLILHLHLIRSFEKFTSEGMNYNYTDLFQLTENTFPAEFGGGPGDYQLVEEEDSNGQTRISIVVHPEIGALDEDRLLSRLREALGEKPWHSRFWNEAGTLRVKRAEPYASPRGKILPLHIRH